MLSGHSETRSLTKEDIRALDLNTAAICGIKLIGMEDYWPEYWKKLESK
jgi:hypothetical protein